MSGVKTVVIGAGPAGMMAAIAAAWAGSAVTVFEALGRPGVKLLATGGGRCNLTNILPDAEIIARFGRQGRFMTPALKALPTERLRGFFAERGVPTVAEDGVHVFPKSNRAADILAALLAELEKQAVRIVVSTPVRELLIENDAMVGVRTDAGPIAAARVILAAGGKGYPALGGGDNAYRLAAQAGHASVSPQPALVGLRTAEDWPKKLTGIVLPNARVAIDLPKRGGQGDEGELLFTHHGVSGPAAIDLSGDVSRALEKNAEVPLSVNLIATESRASWRTRFETWRRTDGAKTTRAALAERLPRAVADALCELAGNVGNRKIAELDAESREKLCALLTAAPLRVNATEGWEKAMVTRGGVALKNICPETLESRLVKGLFFAGEALDLDGPCGGYNLRWAFSSGFLAGTAAANETPLGKTPGVVYCSKDDAARPSAASKKLD